MKEAANPSLLLRLRTHRREMMKNGQQRNRRSGNVPGGFSVHTFILQSSRNVNTMRFIIYHVHRRALSPRCWCPSNLAQILLFR